LLFYKPYKDRVEDNDLVYGLTDIRRIYQSNYEAFSLLQRSAELTIDNYVITPLERSRLLENAVVDNSAFREVVKKHPKYNSALTRPYFIAKTIDNNDANCLRKNSFIGDPTSVARKCKAGIYWVTKRQNDRLFFPRFSKKCSLHFILDEINFREVVLKTSVHDLKCENLDQFFEYTSKYKCDNEVTLKPLDDHPASNKIKNRSVTGSELRWIFRNRNDKNVQKAIQFWYEGKHCCPPWDPGFDLICKQDVVKLWKLYEPKSEQRPRYRCIAQF
jgi:hypothetical protein